MHIHELKDWPQFRWDTESLAEPLASVRHRQGRLIGRMESLGFNLQREAVLRTLTADVLKRMPDATRHYDQPLTAGRLFGWHAALFPTGRSGMTKIRVGAWRDDATGPMEVASGAIGRERVYFTAPPAARLEREMAAFLEWFNGPAEIDEVLKAGLSHLWFVTIHPFDDGNGRIAPPIPHN